MGRCVVRRGEAASRFYNPPHVALTPGTRLGVYEIIAQIGEGSIPLTVVLNWQEELKRLAPVK